MASRMTEDEELKIGHQKKPEMKAKYGIRNNRKGEVDMDEKLTYKSAGVDEGRERPSAL